MENSQVAINSITGIIRFDPTAAALSKLRERLANIVYETGTAKGMETARKDRAELRGYRTALERARVAEKADALDYGRRVDAKAREITEGLLALENPIDEAIRAEETRKQREKEEREAAEVARVGKIQESIAEIGAVAPRMVGRPSAEIQAELLKMSAFPIGEFFAEFVESALDAKSKAVETLKQLFAGAKAQEEQRIEDERRAHSERAELERLRKQDEERRREQAKKDEEVRVARDAADAKARAAREEADRLAAEARAKLDEEARVQREADEAEAARKRDAQAATDRRLREEQERLEADRREVERQRIELLDGRALLAKFIERFGKRREFAAVVRAINQFLDSAKAAA